MGIVEEVDEGSVIGCDKLILVGLENVDVQVVLVAVADDEKKGWLDCSASVEYSRSAVESVLALACAVWVAKYSSSVVQDHWHFWSQDVYASPDDLVGKLAVRNEVDLETACDRIVGARLSR